MRTCRDRRFRPVTRKLGERSQCQIYSSKPHFSRCAVCTAPIKSRGRGPGIQSVSSGAVGHNYSRDHMAPRAESRQLHHDTLCFNIAEFLLFCNYGVQHPASSRRIARKAGLPRPGQLALGRLEVLRCTSAGSGRSGNCRSARVVPKSPSGNIKQDYKVFGA